MSGAYRTLLILTMLALSCSSQLETRSGHVLQGHIHSRQDNTLRVIPSESGMQTFAELGLIDTTYIGGPVEVPRDTITDIDDPNIAISLGLTAFSMLSLGWATYGLYEGELRQGILPLALGVPLGGASLAAAAVFGLEGIDAFLEGSSSFRWGMGGTGIAVTLLSPIMLAAAAAFDDEIFLTYLTVLMPSFMVTGVAMMAWGFTRGYESSDAEDINAPFLLPSLHIDARGDLLPTLNARWTW